MTTHHPSPLWAFMLTTLCILLLPRYDDEPPEVGALSRLCLAGPAPGQLFWPGEAQTNQRRQYAAANADPERFADLGSVLCDIDNVSEVCHWIG